MLTLSHRAQRLTPSATLGMAARAKALAAKGVKVISFSTGEPDFDTPVFIKDAAKKALDEGFTKYTQVGGIPELKAAIARKFQRDHGLDYAPDEIVATCGGKQAIANALLAMVDAGDEVIVPAPYWVSYPDQVLLADGVPVFVPTSAEQNFLMTPQQLEDAITPRTKVLILNSPSNPTGSAYTAEQLRTLALIAVKHRIAIISDEIYEKLTYDGFVATCLVSACPEARDNTIVINGVSKSYSMTGWRMGYAVGPKHVIGKMDELQSQQTSNLTSFVQKACIAALDGPLDEMQRMRAAFAERRKLIIEGLRTIPGVNCNMPQGAFYAFPDVSHYLNRHGPYGVIHTTEQLADYLLDEAHIATVAGDPFGAPGFLRLSYATSEEHIREGLNRLADGLKALRV